MTIKPPVLFIQGPTAVGKSSLALKLAKYYNTDIISADSRQVYRQLDIGTAKPSLAEQQEVKHHLIDIINPNEPFSAGKFVVEAQKIIDEMHSQNKLPIVCGGTGLYIKSLINGIANIPDIDPELKIDLQNLAEEKGNIFIHNKLMQVDPIAAEKIEVNDLKKALRALEVFEATGKPISAFWKEQENSVKFSPINVLILDERAKIYDRINNRVDLMLDMGLLNEIEALLKKGYKESDPGMLTVGYREFYPFFHGVDSLQRCIDLAKKHSRNYAKRQLTWYRKIDFDLTLYGSCINLLGITDLISKYTGFFKEK